MFRVWPECWESVQLFRALQTQWRVIVGMGGAMWQGLDYSAVWGLLRGAQIPNPDEVFADLQVMEAAAIPVLNRIAAARSSARRAHGP